MSLKTSIPGKEFAETIKNYTLQVLKLLNLVI